MLASQCTQYLHRLIEHPPNKHFFNLLFFSPPPFLFFFSFFFFGNDQLMMWEEQKGKSLTVNFINTCRYREIKTRSQSPLTGMGWAHFHLRARTRWRLSFAVLSSHVGLIKGARLEVWLSCRPVTVPDTWMMCHVQPHPQFTPDAPAFCLRRSLSGSGADRIPF